MSVAEPPSEPSEARDTRARLLGMFLGAVDARTAPQPTVAGRCAWSPACVLG